MLWIFRPPGFGRVSEARVCVNPKKLMTMKTNITIATIAVSLLAVMLFATGCKETVPPTVAMVESSVVVSYDKALMVAEVVSDGRGTITEYGFCYGKQGKTYDTLLCPENGNRFSVELSGLSPSTEYTCMAFARNERGRGYSDLYRFTTMSAVDTIPLVDTYMVKDITYCSAVSSGQVLSGGGQEVMERGICYGVEPKPTIEGTHIALGSGVGPFECQLTDLMPDTRYYVCAYAVCTQGVYYGDQLDFYTKVLPMEVLTGEVSDVTATRVMAEGKVTRDGGYEVTESGFCWGTEHEPTIEGLHIKASVGLGVFRCYFSGLEKGRTHYVRAYAINEEGVAYGNEVEFVPDDSFFPWPNGTLPGLFSVSPERQVRFSQGNLQYYPDDDVWRFAERQWDFVGGTCWGEEIGDMNVGTVYANGAKCDNTKVFRYYPGWIDLFGWGTSGWDNGNTYYRPYDFAGHVYECEFYGPHGNFDLTGEYAEADWGIYNTVINGGSRQWRTPTADEFLYLLTERHTPSGIRFAMAMVAGVRGMVVLPDDWNESTYYLRAVNEFCYYSMNTITAREWQEMLEPAGAAFMPAGGSRYQYTAYDGIYFDWFNNEDFIDCSMFSAAQYSPFYVSGSYWTSSQFLDENAAGVNNAYGLKIITYDSDPLQIAGFIKMNALRCKGYSVRLISEE